MKLVGANPSPRVMGLGELPGKSNYFLGKDTKWRTNVSRFARVSYAGIYPGIDLVYYGSPAKPGECCFLEAAHGERPWAHPGSDFHAVSYGRGGSIWFAHWTPWLTPIRIALFSCAPTARCPMAR